MSRQLVPGGCLLAALLACLLPCISAAPAVAETAPPQRTATQQEAQRLVENFRHRHFYDLGDPDARADLERLAEIKAEAVEAAAREIDDTFREERRRENWMSTYKPVFILKKFGADARPALPQLIRALDHSHGLVQSAAAEVLGAIGPPAQGALPKLEKLAVKERTNERWRQHFRTVISQIDPSRADQPAPTEPAPR